MKTKFFTFIKPLLSVIDNGNFFRKPFSWLYVLIAIVSLLAPVYLIYSAVNLHIAYQYREKCRIVRKIAWEEFQKVKVPYENAIEVKKQSENTASNAYKNYKNANSNANYYYNYYSYGYQNYYEAYQNAKREAKEYLALYESARKELEKANNEIVKLEPGYERAAQNHKSKKEQHEGAQQQYNNTAIMGAFHGKEGMQDGNIAMMGISLTLTEGMQNENNAMAENFSYGTGIK